MLTNPFIGIDIGGGSTKIGLVNARGTILTRRRIPVVEGEDLRRSLPPTYPPSNPCWPRQISPSPAASASAFPVISCPTVPRVQTATFLHLMKSRLPRI